MMCFFNRYIFNIPDATDVMDVTLKDVTYIAMTGVLGIKKERWPFLAELKKFKTEEWPAPPFFRIDVVRGFVTIVEFDNVDPTRRVREWVDSDFAIDGLPMDCSSGPEGVEIELTNLSRMHGPIIPLWRRWKFDRSMLK
ncbi:hypothetical protein YWS52_29990 [Chitiniphilus shinanonensis]